MANRANKEVKKHTETKRSLVIDIGELASFIEETLEQYLSPYPAGIYLADRVDPVMVSSKAYFFEVVVQKDMSAYAHLEERHRPASFNYAYSPVVSLEQALNEPWDIVDQPEGEVVVTHRQLRGASTKPRLPVHGLQIAHEIIQNQVESSRAYLDIPAKKIEEIILPHLAEQYRRHPDALDSTGMVMAANEIFEECRELLNIIRHFTEGEYIMHELNNLTPTQLTLDQKGDFRIMDWHRRLDPKA